MGFLCFCLMAGTPTIFAIDKFKKLIPRYDQNTTDERQTSFLQLRRPLMSPEKLDTGPHIMTLYLVINAIFFITEFVSMYPIPYCR